MDFIPSVWHGPFAPATSTCPCAVSTQGYLPTDMRFSWGYFSGLAPVVLDESILRSASICTRDAANIMSFFHIVELQQQRLIAQPTVHERLSSVLHTRYPFTSATNTFQYLPAEPSHSSPPQYWDSDLSQPIISDAHSYKSAVQQAASDHDRLPGDGSPYFDTSATSSPELLAEFWRSVRRTARTFLRWCKATVYLSTGPEYQESSTPSVEDGCDAIDDTSWQCARPDSKMSPAAFENAESILSQIPQYVVDYAPLVHLFSGEEYWPCDMGEHLYHTTPKLNYTPILPSSEHPQLDNLDALNRWEYGRHLFLTSDDNVEDHPEWLMGTKNIPSAFTSSAQQLENDPPSQVVKNKTHGGRSHAPAVLVVVNKGDGIVDAFWFFFYSFNLGNVVVLRFGNHVGDWEHSVVRFQNGKPKAVFVSEHFFGQAYSYRAMEKIGKRPVIYSATGTHAMYATPGTHSYILPWGLLHDRTDRGPLWDPALNSHMYTYDFANDTLRSSNFTPAAPTKWFHFAGHWGDKQYPLGDSRQYLFANNYHYVSGPLGPKFKNLGRRKICQGRESERCEIKNWLGGSRLRRVRRPFEEEDMPEEERVGFSIDKGNF